MVADVALATLAADASAGGVVVAAQRELVITSISSVRVPLNELETRQLRSAGSSNDRAFAGSAPSATVSVAKVTNFVKRDA